MKNQLFRIAVTAGLAAVVGGALLMAQSGAQAKAEIPFGFHVKDRVMDAGTYTVRKMNANGIIAITNTSTNESFMLLTGPGKDGRTADPKLVFHAYGDRYFLSEVWFDTDGYARRVGTGKLERDLTAAAPRTQPTLAYALLK